MLKYFLGWTWIKRERSWRTLRSLGLGDNTLGLSAPLSLYWSHMVKVFSQKRVTWLPVYGPCCHVQDFSLTWYRIACMIDNWLGIGSITNAYPRLFLNSTQRDKYIQNMGSSEREGWIWNLGWHWRWFVWEEDMVMELKNLIQNITLSQHGWCMELEGK